MVDAQLKPVVWMGSSLRDLQAFPRRVRRNIGLALRYAQLGGKHPDAEPLRGFRGAGVLEVIEDYAGSTYRAIYTVRLPGRVYVLHVFQKKSTRGIRTPRHQIELVRQRLRQAEEVHRQLAGGA